MPQPEGGRRDPVPLSAAASARVLATVLAPLAARGPVVRRPRVTYLADSLRTTDRGLATLLALRRRYDGRPVVLRLPRTRVVLPLDPDDVRVLLDGSPWPFTPASREKVAALGVFQPGGVLVSGPAQRPARRALVEEALRPDLPVHPDTAVWQRVVDTECGALVERTLWEGGGRELAWPAFAAAFDRVVRRVAFGDALADDPRTTGLLRRLRRAANLAYLARPHREEQERFARLVRDGVAGAPDGTLAAAARAAAPDLDAAAAQVPHWLFAADAAGMTAFRALAVVAARAERADLAGLPAEAAGHDGPGPREAVLETLRLWPTTLAILRDGAAATRWGGTWLPEGTRFVVVSQLFHRDPDHLVAPDAFAPGLWCDGGPRRDETGVVPFSAGPAACAGREVATFLAAAALAAVAGRADLAPAPGAPDLGGAHLPTELDPYRLRVRLARGDA